jgi:glycosyltransferase involved in cell wall biosynthesis
MNSYFVSIIIPTYNDWVRLSKCLNALEQQNFSKEKFEIIVVNNNPDDPVPNGFFIPENCSVITEQKPGSYAARNAALKIAKGEIVGFTDSDCIPDNNWIRNAVNYLIANPECSRIAGNVSIFFETINPTRAQLYDKLYAFNQKGYVNKSGTGVTANLFTYKKVFDKIGYFDESLMSGGDFLWGIRAYKNGYKIEYVEEVIINHPARDTLRELAKKEKRVGGSQAKFLNKKSNTLLDFLKFLKEFRPRLNDMRFIFSQGKEMTITDKICIYILRQYLLMIRAYSKLKVQMHKKPNRA